MSGAGENWEYTDGRAAWVNQELLSVTFDENDWTYIGRDGLESRDMTSAARTTPVPVSEGGSVSKPAYLAEGAYTFEMTDTYRTETGSAANTVPANSRLS
jgi:hypothetical protein